MLIILSAPLVCLSHASKQARSFLKHPPNGWLPLLAAYQQQQHQAVPREVVEEEGGARIEEEAGSKIVQATAPTAAATATATTGGGGGGDGAVRWYERAYDYWEDGENCPLDDDGVLGGYGHISPTDIAGSGAFLDELRSMRPLLGDSNAAGGAGRGDVDCCGVGWASLGLHAGGARGRNLSAVVSLFFSLYLLELCLMSDRRSTTVYKWFLRVCELVLRYDDGLRPLFTNPAVCIVRYQYDPTIRAM